ncbi:hypothetical protein LTR50_003440 [Elasticomyces elasticus]|nr:hypothetical protein LTR50_003440 [Elasticomyces elasticus]
MAASYREARTPHVHLERASSEDSSSTPFGDFQLPPPPQHHFPGDGLDFRRPVTSTSGLPQSPSDPPPPRLVLPTVSRDEPAAGPQSPAMNSWSFVDLTEEEDDGSVTTASNTPLLEAQAQAGSSRATRPPRHPHPIIDLEDDGVTPQLRPARRPTPFYRQSRTQTPRPDTLHRAGPLQDGPEIQFVSSRVRTPPRRTPIHREDSDVILVETRITNGPNLQPPLRNANIIAEARGNNRAAAGQYLQHARHQILHNEFGAGHGRYLHDRVNRLNELRVDEIDMEDEEDVQVIGGMMAAPNFPVPNFIPPYIDYNAVAFDLGHPRNAPGRPQTPEYVPPPAPEEGFTRTPLEDDVLVCPNCLDELGVGDTEEKKQVWIVKKCGHGYCGTCTNRRKDRPSKGKAKATDPTMPKPFKTCVVEGCKSAVAAKSMIQLYL